MYIPFYLLYYHKSFRFAADQWFSSSKADKNKHVKRQRSNHVQFLCCHLTWRGAKDRFILWWQGIKEPCLNQSSESVLMPLVWPTYLRDISFLIVPPPFKLYWSCQVHQCIRTLWKGKDWSRSKALNHKEKKRDLNGNTYLQLASFTLFLYFCFRPIIF